MYKHLFKLMWNKRKQNFLLLSEIFVSFIVIFAVFSFLVFYYVNYRKPSGITYENVWAINIENPDVPSTADSAMIYLNTIEQALRLPQIEEVSFAGNNIPYSSSTWLRGISYNGKEYGNINNFIVGDGYKAVWGAKLVEGRWFTPQDAVSKEPAVIINESLRDEIFGKKKVAGLKLGEKDAKYRVIGVMQDVKVSGDFWPAGKGMYTRIDTGMARSMNTVVIKVKSNADAAFEARLYKLLSNTVKSANISIEHVSDMRRSKNNTTIIPMIIFISIACFLLINVALGLFGVMWYNINKRKGEIGLRRAIGASGNAVSSQLVIESMILATMSIALGTFFAVQFPLLNVFNIAAGVYLTAILFAIIFIYLLVLLCSLYPGKQAAAIHPAIALHEE